jgi:hypothetical protein
MKKMKDFMEEIVSLEDVKVGLWKCSGKISVELC